MSFWGAPNILEEITPLFNEMVLVYDTDVGRLVGYHEDLIDCYYVVRRAGLSGEEGKITYCSAVGKIEPLEPLVDDYAAIDAHHAAHGCPREKIRLIYTGKEYQTYFGIFDDEMSNFG